MRLENPAIEETVTQFGEGSTNSPAYPTDGTELRDRRTFYPSLPDPPGVRAPRADSTHPRAGHPAKVH
jgi:hypothetical protein